MMPLPRCTWLVLVVSSCLLRGWDEFLSLFKCSEFKCSDFLAHLAVATIALLIGRKGLVKCCAIELWPQGFGDV